MGKKDSFSETFCARHFKSFGHYIIISIWGRRTVLIIPETTFNAGWNLIADKIDRFINCSSDQVNEGESRLADKELPYADALRNSRWSNKEVVDGQLSPEANAIHVKECLDSLQKEVLNRCLVGFFVGTGNKSEAAAFADTRRWASSIWSPIQQ